MSGPTIAILGDGLLAALAAVTLAHARGEGRGITLVGTGRGLNGLGPVGRGIVALPDWLRSPPIAALPLERVAVRAHASFSLGIAFTGWSGRDGAWFLPFGDAGAPIGSVAFHQLASRVRAGGGTLRLADYSLAAMAAQAGRFAFPAHDPRSPLSSVAFAQHFDGLALADMLRNIAQAAGVASTTASFARAEAADDQIAALVLDDDTRLTAGLYIDCTGPDALLIGDSLGVPFERWPGLPCDVAIERIEAATDSPPPYALSAAHRGGWRATVPLAGALSTVDYLSSQAGLPMPADAVPFASGTRRRPWCGNCVAIGAAATLVEPMFGTPLLAAQVALDRLARLLPAMESRGREADEFNRIHASAAERLHDMARALYKTNDRIGDALWDAARDAPVADTLAQTLDLFASRGTIPAHDDDLFEPADWALLLDGQGIRPRRIDPLAAAITDDAIAAHLSRLRERLIAALRTMKPHREVLADLRTPA